MRFHRFLSYIFHPISFSVLWTVFYLSTYPGYIAAKQATSIISIVLISTVIFPILLLFMLYRFNLIHSFHLNTINERRFPLLLNSFLALLTGKMLLRVASIENLAWFLIAGGLCLLIAYIFLFFNKKVSLHTMGLSSLLGALIFQSFDYQQNYLILIAVGFILLGIIANSRIQLKAHTGVEVLLGSFLGISTQILIPLIYQNI